MSGVACCWCSNLKSTKVVESKMLEIAFFFLPGRRRNFTLFLFWIEKDIAWSKMKETASVNEKLIVW